MKDRVIKLIQFGRSILKEPQPTCLAYKNTQVDTRSKCTAKTQRYDSTSLLTTEVEQVSKEEASLVEGLKLWQGAFFEVSPKRLSPSFLREQGLQHGTHHVQLCTRHTYTPAVHEGAGQGGERVHKVKESLAL